MAEQRLEGLALSSKPLGEHDRLLTLLSEEEGLTRLAVPGARRPKSSLAAAVPLAHLRLQVGGGGSSGTGLKRVRQLKVVRNYSLLGQRLETLAAAQALAEICLALVPSGSPAPGMLNALLVQIGRLEELLKQKEANLEALATAVQGSVHLLAIGGYALPLANCSRSGERLEPPIGNWEWRCSLLPSEGLAIGAIPGARIMLNASELALLQRLLRPALPRKGNGELMGPEAVWLHLLSLVESWCSEHLGRKPKAFQLLRTGFGAS